MTTVDEIKSLARVSEVAARYGEVRRRGRLSVCRCLCGENRDRNPSFTLYDEDNHFHCYACGRHGSVIDLVMLAEGVDFRDAVERLRRDATRLPYRSGEEAPRRMTRSSAPAAHAPDNAPIRADVQAALDATTQHYHAALLHAPPALAYLHRRGLTDDTIRRLRLGYGDGELGRALFSQRHSPGLLARIGLLTPAGEMLRERVVFPILDGAHTQFLIGRALSEGQQPKYLGLPYGLVHKQPMACGRPARGVIVVEGPVDYAALMQWGFDAEFGLLALLGTAHTKAVPHLAAGKAPRILIALDQDRPGHDAALRLMSALVERGLRARVSVLTWHEAKDCGELLQQGDRGRNRFEQALVKAGA